MALSKEQILNALKEATSNLEMPSEADAPFETFFWPTEIAVTVEDIVTQNAGSASTSATESQEVEEFLEDASTIEDWMDAAEKKNAKRFAHLIEVLQTCLEDPLVYLFGERRRVVFIAGAVPGGVAGLKTTVIET